MKTPARAVEEPSLRSEISLDESEDALEGGR